MKESSFFHRYKEIILGIFMIAFASFYLYHATFIRTRSSVSVSAKLIPELLGCLVVVLGIAQIVSGAKYLLEARKKDAAEGNKPVLFAPSGIKNAVPVILTFAIILLYAIAFEPVGFIVSSTLCMFSQMWVLTPKSKFRPLRFLLLSLAVAVVVYIAFRKGLNLSLPEGVLRDLPIV